jgi:hypothetical protein
MTLWQDDNRTGEKAGDTRTGWFMCYGDHDGYEIAIGPAFAREKDALMAMRAVEVAGITAQHIHESDDAECERIEDMMIEALAW